MIEPKTNWKDGDYFEVEDYNRIVSNLRELADRYGASYSLAQKQVGDTLPNVRNDIPNAFNNICVAAGWKYHISTAAELTEQGMLIDFFSADELNLIESISAIPEEESNAEYSAGLIYDTGATYGGGALG